MWSRWFCIDCCCRADDTESFVADAAGAVAETGVLSASVINEEPEESAIGKILRDHTSHLFHSTPFASGADKIIPRWAAEDRLITMLIRGVEGGGMVE